MERTRISEPLDLPEGRWEPKTAISTVLPSVLAALGADAFFATYSRDHLVELPSARGACVVLVDGLGYETLKKKAGHVPFLRSILEGKLASGREQRLYSATPTTTASSLTSFGTALPPGQHGLVGYDVVDPDQDKVVNVLGRWDPGVEPRLWQPYPTIFEQLSGILPTTTVSLPRFASSPLTSVALAGSAFVARKTAQDRVTAVVESFGAQPRSLVYLYWSELDKAGHRYGIDSAQWEHAFEELDAALAQLSRRLPRGTLMVLTADHGMVDVPRERRIDFSSYPELLEGVRHTAGEPRMVQLHLEADADVMAVRNHWQRRFGEEAWIVTRQDAIEAGWFGPVRPEVELRIGDLLVAPHAVLALYDTRRVGTLPLEVVGQHGSLTGEERAIPLITVEV